MYLNDGCICVDETKSSLDHDVDHRHHHNNKIIIPTMIININNIDTHKHIKHETSEMTVMTTMLSRCPVNRSVGLVYCSVLRERHEEPLDAKHPREH